MDRATQKYEKREIATGSGYGVNRGLPMGNQSLETSLTPRKTNPSSSNTILSIMIRKQNRAAALNQINPLHCLWYINKHLFDAKLLSNELKSAYFSSNFKFFFKFYNIEVKFCKNFEKKNNRIIEQIYKFNGKKFLTYKKI